jgi:putative transcriptional regulator
MKDAAQSLQAGKLLIASPALQDDHFRRSVILLAEHGTEGSLGFILNKAIEASLQDAVEGFLYFDQKLSVGGPVETQALFYVHRFGADIPGSQAIAHGLYWGGDFEVLKSFVNNHQVAADALRFFVGYAGWSAGQLEGEIAEEAWLLAEGNAPTLLDPASAGDLWRGYIKNMDFEYAIWANLPEDPSLN